jgi:hypothetical protein
VHPDIRIELGRDRQAELIAAGEASRAVARAGGDERVLPRWLARVMQARRLADAANLRAGSTVLDVACEPSRE